MANVKTVLRHLDSSHLQLIPAESSCLAFSAPMGRLPLSSSFAAFLSGYVFCDMYQVAAMIGHVCQQHQRGVSGETEKHTVFECDERRRGQKKPQLCCKYISYEIPRTM